MPCIFIRLAGCNLRCAWCDTPASWEPGTPMSPLDIVSAISKYPTKLAEVTGGEPLFQPNTPSLLDVLLNYGYEVMLETNGSLPLDGIPPEVIKIVDVKCPGSGYGDSFLLENLPRMNARDELKFVLASREDYAFASRFIADNHLWERTILFSPVVLQLQPELLAEWMLRDGSPARLQIQLHRVLGMP